MQAPIPRTPIYGIDVARFFAATIVVFYHFSAKPFLTPAASTLRPLLTESWSAPAGAVWWGWIGVQIFFVISGAVIAYSIRGATPRSFFAGRMTRLWPAMFICATIIAALNLIFWRHHLGQELDLYLRSLVFWPTGPWVSGQIWTLPIEIAFYGLAWLLVLLRGAERLEQFAWALGLASAAFWLLHQAGFAETRGLFALLLLQHGIYFALGIVIMSTGRKGYTPGRATLAAICVAGAWLEVAATLQHEQPGRGFPPAIPFAIWIFVCAAIWWSIAYRDFVAARLRRTPGSSAAVRAIGVMTYPLYLIHVQPGGVLMSTMLAIGASVWTAAATGYLAAIAFAALIALQLEPRLRRILTRWLNGVLDGAAKAAETNSR